MIKKLSVLCLSLLVMSACVSSSITKLSETSGSLTYSQASQLDPDLITNINTLAFYLQDDGIDQNQFISSLSIYLALAMTSHGTDGTSAQQFKALLNPQNTDETTWLEAIKALQGNLNAMEKVKIALSNSLWIRDSFASEVKADFLKRNQDYFGAMIASVDFDQPSAVDDINGWVKKNTNKLIDKVIDSIDPSTIMFLINTIYFKGNWLSPFEVNETHDAVFHGSTEKTVKFMSQIGSFKYVENEAYQAILMPYEGNATGMLIVLGKNETNPIRNDADFNAVLDAMTNTSVKITMPKVDIATKLNLIEPLKALGLVDPFISGTADFSRLADAELYISKIFHKARLKIDEKGTEAAAVTVVIIDETSLPVADVTMTIDRPFQVFIIDQDNQLILFSGSIQDVQSAE